MPEPSRVSDGGLAAYIELLSHKEQMLTGKYEIAKDLQDCRMDLKEAIKTLISAGVVEDVAEVEEWVRNIVEKYGWNGEEKG